VTEALPPRVGRAHHPATHIAHRGWRLRGAFPSRDLPSVLPPFNYAPPTVSDMCRCCTRATCNRCWCRRPHPWSNAENTPGPGTGPPCTRATSSRRSRHRTPPGCNAGSSLAPGTDCSRKHERRNRRSRHKRRLGNKVECMPAHGTIPTYKHPSHSRRSRHRPPPGCSGAHIPAPGRYDWPHTRGMRNQH
jgi:hypothetical protein